MAKSADLKQDNKTIPTTNTMCPILAEKLAKKIIIETVTEAGGEMPHKELREASIKKWLRRYTSSPYQDHLDRGRLLVAAGIFDLKDEKRLSRDTLFSNWKLSKRDLTNGKKFA